MSDDALNQPMIKKRNLALIGAAFLALWAFSIQTGSLVMMIIAGVLTLLAIGVGIWAYRYITKQKQLIGTLQGATQSPEARRDALAKLSEGKDAGSVPNLMARAQLLAAEDPEGALKLLEPIDLKSAPAGMQDDLALLKAQLLLNFGRTKDARPLADLISVDNPQRKQVRNMAVAVIGEAWARTGKPKEALALLDTVDLASEPNEQLRAQIRIARVFGMFASGKKGPAKEQLVGLSTENVNYLGKFLLPQFRVHPELQTLARSVLEKHPEARKMAKDQARRQRR